MDRSFQVALGQELRAERAAQGLTRQALADACGLAESTVKRMESGVRDATIAQLQLVCGIFGVPVSTMMARAETRRSGKFTPPPTEG